MPQSSVASREQTAARGVRVSAAAAAQQETGLEEHAALVHEDQHSQAADSIGDQPDETHATQEYDSTELEEQEPDPPEVIKARWREALRQRLGVESERVLIHDLGVYLELAADRPWVQTMKLRWAVKNAERDRQQLLGCDSMSLL